MVGGKADVIFTLLNVSDSVFKFFYSFSVDDFELKEERSSQLIILGPLKYSYFDSDIPNN